MNGIFRDFFRFSRWPNEALHHGPTVLTGGVGAESYTLAIVEFDDQGICFGREKRIAELDRCLADFSGKWPIIVAFVHGWKHNAAADDGNLRLFRTMLARLARSVSEDVSA